MQAIEYFRELNFASVVLRILCAMAVGGIVGLDRERKGRAAGFRTYMLVALGAAMTVMLGQYLSVMLETVWADKAAKLDLKTDVVRFGAQVINGVGFLGAGTIIVTGRQQVKGLTTAAGLWASACLGLAIGAGFYECVFIGFVLILVCMKLLPKIEDFVTSKALNMNIYISMDSVECLGNIINCFKESNFRILDADIEKEEHATITQINAVFSVKMTERHPHTEILAKLSTLDGIIYIEQT